MFLDLFFNDVFVCIIVCRYTDVTTVTTKARGLPGAGVTGTWIFCRSNTLLSTDSSPQPQNSLNSLKIISHLTLVGKKRILISIFPTSFTVSYTSYNHD